MAEYPRDSGSPGDLYSSSDQDEAMDTDSETEDAPEMKVSISKDGDESDVESSIRMEISDNEDASEDPDSHKGNGLFHGDPTDSLPSGQPAHHSETNGGDRIAQASDTLQQTAMPPRIEDIRDLSQSVYGLTIPLWQNVLSFVPLQSLGRLLCTSRVFHALLDPSSEQEVTFQDRFREQAGFISNKSLWSQSRVRHTSSLPIPLENKSEIDMWRLLCGKRCQICQQIKPSKGTRDNENPWHAGPGENGIRPIWICGIMICGTCLPNQCQQEVQLQLSSTFPSFLIKGLPPVFLTQNNDWIPESILLSRPAPPGLQIRKIYYQSDVDHILHQFEAVKAQGESKAAEWLSSLETQRQQRLDDAARWEQWELQGGWRNLVIRQSPTQSTPAPLVTASQQVSFHPVSSGIPHSSTPPSVLGPHGVHPPNIPPFMSHNPPPYHLQGPPMMPMMPPMAPTPFQGYGAPPFPGFQPPAAPLNPPIGQGRPRRSLQEVNEARAARRQEIERRCLELDPPITPRVLSHMQSFQAALQISFPFTDKDWEVLKPRLLAQREAAEAQEAELAEQLKAIQDTATQPSVEVLLKKDHNELPESDWEQLQAPVREVLAKYAGEYIDEKWDGGSRVNQDNVSEFVTDVLLTVRVKYYESLNQANPHGGPQSPRIPLSLESMKWLYDNKVKSVAEIHQKELFQCIACDSNSRFYGFEGVIQHYAAKHTTALSLGNIIVNWRTEWPEVSPFTPRHEAMTNGAHSSTTQANGRPTSSSNPGDYGQPFQAPGYVQQGFATGATQYPFNYGSYQQAPPFYGQQDAVTYSAGSNAFAQSSPYGVAPNSEQGAAALPVPYMSSSATSDLHRQQLIDMAQYSRELWNSTMGIKELPPSVRIYVVIHHMSVKFEKKFRTAPEVSMFLHGLNENAQMRPIRSLNGLVCKACSIDSHDFEAERKKFTLPALVNHFRSRHLEQAHISADVPALDWRSDMIDLPETSTIEGLVSSNGMDERKFHLIAEAFPEVFPSPLPPLNTLKEARAKAEADRIRLENLRALDFTTSTATRQPQQVAVSEPSPRPSPRRASGERPLSRSPYLSDAGTIEPPKEDEYDPSRITFIGDIVEHSGVRRSVSQHQQKPEHIPLPPGIISLGVVDSNGQPESPHTQGGYADRLLRHHRGPARRPAESQHFEREAYLAPGAYAPSSANVQQDTNAVDRFLRDLQASKSYEINRNAYDSNAYPPAEAASTQRSEYAVQPVPREPDHSYPPPQYSDLQPEPYTETRNPGQPFGVQTYVEQAYYQGRSPPRRRESYTDYPIQTQSYNLHSRDRSRSPRRSLPREHTGYETYVQQSSYETRPDIRWRGESPPRNEYTDRSHVARAGDSFVGRDAQGRSVRYIAVPVQEYESQPARYPPARAALPEGMQYLERAEDMVGNAPDGRFYVVDNRGPARYDNAPMEDVYRNYK